MPNLELLEERREMAALRTAKYKAQIERRCVHGKEAMQILELCHSGPTGGHNAVANTARIVFEAGDHRFKQIHELNVFRNQAYENSTIYKERINQWHDQHVKQNKEFKQRDRVLLFNSRLKLFPGKLKSRWSGPCKIKRVFPYGTVELEEPNGGSSKGNGHRVKHYLKKPLDKDGEEILDLHTKEN
nr:hypothetical protein [Tanacetum cinerariifolium]